MIAETNRLLTIKEAAGRLTMTPAFIYKLVEDGKLPAYKIGRSIRIQEDDLEKYLDSRRLKLKPKKYEHAN